MTATTTSRQTETAVANLVRFLETGIVPDGAFTPDVFSDLSLPQWRIQTATAGDLAAVRAANHPIAGQVHVERVDPTEHGFTIEFEERWEHQGQRWYAREMIRADVVDGTVVELSVYCTGDWDQATQRAHSEQVRLIRS